MKGIHDKTHADNEYKQLSDTPVGNSFVNRNLFSLEFSTVFINKVVIDRYNYPDIAYRCAFTFTKFQIPLVFWYVALGVVPVCWSFPDDLSVR